ncbi:unnamed protein product, partial [Staurois parvus]
GPCPVVGCRLLPKPLLRGRLPSVARGPCPVVGCRLLPEPLPRGRLSPVARAPSLKGGDCLKTPPV